MSPPPSSTVPEELSPLPPPPSTVPDELSGSLGPGRQALSRLWARGGAELEASHAGQKARNVPAGVVEVRVELAGGGGGGRLAQDTLKLGQPGGGGVGVRGGRHGLQPAQGRHVVAERQQLSDGGRVRQRREVCVWGRGRGR